MKQETLKKIVELAEGFEVVTDDVLDFEYSIPNGDLMQSWCNHFRTDRWKKIFYPLLLHRAVNGWNQKSGAYTIEVMAENVEYFGKLDYRIINNYFNYQKTEYLTPQEQAIEACLIELLEGK